MLHIIEKLREKPEAYRKRVALIVAASIALIIFFIWLSAMMVKLRTIEEESGKQEKDSIFTEVKNDFSETFKDEQEQFKEIKEELESVMKQSQEQLAKPVVIATTIVTTIPEVQE